MHRTEYACRYVLGDYGAVIPMYQQHHVRIHRGLCVCPCMIKSQTNDTYIPFVQARLCLFKVKGVMNKNAINTRDTVTINTIYPQKSV